MIGGYPYFRKLPLYSAYRKKTHSTCCICIWVDVSQSDLIYPHKKARLGQLDRQESNMDCALMVTGAALEQISHESLMEDLGSAWEIFDESKWMAEEKTELKATRCPDI